MTDDSADRRHLHALRAHIDALLAAGASLEGRDPVRLSLNGQTFLVRHGMLVSENDDLDFLETLSDVAWTSERQREQAIEMCRYELEQAIDEATRTLQHWECK
ncbi:hypothetical protein [Stutzerimonas stutzeri]|uniref:hypothetical protein n=1 Tax=Stutzerimonas stutzeri TaxID=316 RepID=UPI001CFDD217|nr:hypothetical protein [Stutzerimonas stutzeri]